MIKAVLFDMDGLIFDTESVYKKSWQHAARKQNLELSNEFYQQFIGVQDADCERLLKDHFGNEIDMKRYCVDRDRHFKVLRKDGIAIKPGFDALFQSITQRNLRMAIVTSSHRDDVQLNFQHSNYLAQYDLIISAEDVARGKPNPDCYEMACAKLNLKPDECMVLEDSNNGGKAGLEAGCRVVMIPDLAPIDPILLSKVTVVDSLDKVITLLHND